MEEIKDDKRNENPIQSGNVFDDRIWPKMNVGNSIRNADKEQQNDDWLDQMKNQQKKDLQIEYSNRCGFVKRKRGQYMTVAHVVVSGWNTKFDSPRQKKVFFWICIASNWRTRQKQQQIVTFNRQIFQLRMYYGSEIKIMNTASNLKLLYDVAPLKFTTQLNYYCIVHLYSIISKMYGFEWCGHYNNFQLAILELVDEVSSRTCAEWWCILHLIQKVIDYLFNCLYPKLLYCLYLLLNI